jgi:separase
MRTMEEKTNQSLILDASVAITLRRDILGATQDKFPALVGNDLQWPIMGADRIQNLRPHTKASPKFSFDDDDNQDSDERSLKSYWNSIRSRYQTRKLDISSLSVSQMIGLPLNWTVININVTEDKSMLFVTRQEGGDIPREPLIFCIPLKGRRDNGSGEDEEENLTFGDALEEFNDIVKLSDEGTKAAAHIKDDQEARATWWKQRGELNARMRELLENIEFCWLGAFKVCGLRFAPS